MHAVLIIVSGRLVVFFLDLAEGGGGKGKGELVGGSSLEKDATACRRRGESSAAYLYDARLFEEMKGTGGRA